MTNLLVTYDIYNAGERIEFIHDFENILTDLGLTKQSTNQSTYFGSYRGGVGDFLKDILSAVGKFNWQNADVVTIYHPMVSTISEKRVADIGRHCFKNEGSKILNHIIYK